MRTSRPGRTAVSASRRDGWSGGRSTFCPHCLACMLPQWAVASGPTGVVLDSLGPEAASQLHSYDYNYRKSSDVCASCVCMISLVRPHRSRPPRALRIWSLGVQPP
jgi:hypothetical protein